MRRSAAKSNYMMPNDVIPHIPKEASHTAYMEPNGSAQVTNRAQEVMDEIYHPSNLVDGKEPRTTQVAIKEMESAYSLVDNTARNTAEVTVTELVTMDCLYLNEDDCLYGLLDSITHCTTQVAKTMVESTDALGPNKSGCIFQTRVHKPETACHLPPYQETTVPHLIAEELGPIF